MTWKNALKKKLERRGLSIQRWPPTGTLEGALATVLHHRDVRVVLDVGAHRGQYGLLLRRIGFRGTIHSFEPNPAVYQTLAQRSAPDWVIHELALGAAPGTQSLHVFGDEQLSSLHEITPWAEEHWTFDRRRTIDVHVDTVDRLIAREGIDPRSTLLKVDAQAHDAAVLEGATLAMRELLALQIELPFVALYEGAASFDELMHMALERGFRLVGLFPIARDRVEHLIPIEFDGLFVRSDLPLHI